VPALVQLPWWQKKDQGPRRMRLTIALVLAVVALCPTGAAAALLASSPLVRRRCAGSRWRGGTLCATEGVVSPFEQSSVSKAKVEGPLALTLENVELVLDEMRPYLKADGGNVAVSEIDGGIVRLELQGACGTCPSSTMTMKMGLERGLREKIPEIVEVEQVAPDGPQLTEEGIEEVLEEIRPFLKMAGGDCHLVSLEPLGVQPTACLSITGLGPRSIPYVQRLRAV